MVLVEKFLCELYVVLGVQERNVVRLAPSEQQLKQPWRFHNDAYYTLGSVLRSQF